MKFKSILIKMIFLILIFTANIITFYEVVNYEEQLKYVAIVFLVVFILFASFLYLKQKSNIFSDIYFLFPAVFFAYSIFGPLYMILYKKPVTYEVIASYDIVLQTIYYYLYIFSILVSLIILFYKENNIQIKSKKYVIGEGVVFFDIISFAIVSIFIINFLIKGGFSLLSLPKETLVRVLNVYGNKIISYGDFWMIAYTFYIAVSSIGEYIENNKFEIKINIFRYSIISIYWGLNVLFGMRRGLLFLILMFFVWMFQQKQINKKKVLIATGLLVSGFLLLGFFREKTQYNDTSIMFFKVFGEFINPQWITYFYLVNTKPLLYGITYLYTLPYLFPRSIMPNKPEDLGIVFWREAKTNTALAFNPVAEGILNFGIYSIILVPLIIFITIYMVRKIKVKDTLYIVVCGATLNFMRGQFAVWFFECLLVYLIIKSMHIVIRKRCK